MALWWASRGKRLARRSSLKASRGGTPGAKHAGGHRSRVTPVPIPNTEVKLATADGTAWETVWESRSLPAVIPRKPDVRDHVGLSPFQRAALPPPATQFPMSILSAVVLHTGGNMYSNIDRWW